jgi:DNA-binding CsgD family transcriptional regulator
MAKSWHATPREEEILSLVAYGLLDKEIAHALGVSYRTVRFHLENLFERNGLRTRSGAVAAWMRASHDPAHIEPLAEMNATTASESALSAL